MSCNIINSSLFDSFSYHLLQWEKLEMSPVEQRKVLCSITFHVVAITCVVWSLYVLIERTAEEMRSGVLEWPFWTKLVVVAIGNYHLLPIINNGACVLSNQSLSACCHYIFEQSVLSGTK